MDIKYSYWKTICLKIGKKKGPKVQTVRHSTNQALCIPLKQHILQTS